MKIFTTLLAATFLVSIASGAPAPAPAAPAAAPTPPPLLEVTLEPVGAVGDSIYNRADTSPEALAKDPVKLHLTIKSTNEAATSAAVSLTAEDMFGKPVEIKGEQQLSVPLQKGEGAQDIPFKAPGPGYFLVHAAVNAGSDTAIAWGDFGIVPLPIPGVRPDSLFSTTGGSLSEAGLDLFQAVGMKKNRICFPASVGSAASQAGLAPGQVPPIDWTDADKKFADYKAHGIWPFLLSGYTLNGYDPLSPLAKETGMFGPPADELRYAKVYALMFQHFPELKVTEFYNEPWLFGYGFAGTAADYDRFQKVFCEEILKLRPDMRIVAGNSSMFVVDTIEPDPSCWKGLLQGITHHPYTKDDGDPSWRAGANARSYDAIRVVADRMGLPYAYLTEAGTAYPAMGSAERNASPVLQLPEVVANREQSKAAKTELAALSDALKKSGGKADAATAARRTELNKTIGNDKKKSARVKFAIQNNIENAAKVVQEFARAAIEGLYQGCGQAPQPEETKYNTAFAVMTHLIEDCPAVADIWPSNELIWGGIFANPKFVTSEVKALPRAKELSVRWNVEIPKERQDDKTKVAIVWSATGESNTKLDTNGTLTILKADGLKAYDMTDREIPAGKDGLIVAFGNNPVYITSETLSVMEMRDRIGHGIIKNVTPVNLYALSLMNDPTQPQKLSVRVENQINVMLQGTLHLKVAGASEETSAPFSIEASKLAEVAVPWPKGVAPNANNQYDITVSAEVSPAGDATASALPITVSRQQIASVAKFVKKTIALNGSLNDWKGITPVLIDSSLLNQEIDLTQYVLDPNLEMPSEDAKAPRIVARVYTAYDKDNVYLAAALNEDTFHNSAGEPFTKSVQGGKPFTLPYKRGMPGPDGWGFPTSGGDCFQFAFGFRDRVPGWGRQMDDPYAWKGDFYDVDYTYIAYPSTEGDQLVRIWGPDPPRLGGHMMTVPNGKIKITRNEATKLTLYEMAIPRSELKLFDPGAGRCRFGFLLQTTGPAKNSQGLNWSDAAGVFDYWQNLGSFVPDYTSHTACESFFGIEK